MCFDAKTSFSTGIFTVITCLLLLGDKGTKYALDTKKIAYTFIYISLVQFLEGFMWMDQGCHLGYNKISTTLIHYIVYLQPTIVYLIGRIGQQGQQGQQWQLLANIIYPLLVFYLIGSQKKLSDCSRPNRDGHLAWNSRLSYLLPLIIPYFILLYWNLYGALSHPMALLTIITISASLLFSSVYFQYSVGEMWCFLSCSIPLVLYFFTKILDGKLGKV